MLRTIVVVSSTLLALSLSSFAQDESTKPTGYLEAQNALLRARQQQRRDMLREALKAQQQAEPPVPVRQVTVQEKANSAVTQDYRKKSEAYLEAQAAVLQARQQQRRDMLREALKAQQQTEPPVPVRQMTAQEKAELRQQLRLQMRQQRDDLTRKEEQ